MSHLNPGLISAYNSLTDKHLTGYFSNTRIRRHLQRAGLITRSGRIVPDKEYRHKLIQRTHQRNVRECLAQAIFHKVLEMERLHQIEIKKKLEEFARRERVHKIKVERSKRYEEDIIRILSPRPPTGARGIRKQHSGPECNSESSESPGSSRPNTAPGKMQRPVRLKPIHSNSTTASLRRSSPYRHHESSNENDSPFNCTMDKECRRRLTTMEASHGISPYCLPVINNFVTPVPPATKRKERGAKVTQRSTLRGRRLRPTTASSGLDITEEPPMLRSSVHQSRVCVNMVYFGKTVHLSNDLTDLRDEVKVFQQHCGGENLCVYKGKLCEGESFRFISRRHRGFPFSLTFFLNGLQVERLSSCCEFKHRKGSRLGGRHGHFGFSSVDGASPCYKCIIAMGLDKKPTPPPKRVKEEGGREESITSPKDAPEMEAERTGGDTGSDYERSQQQEMETQIEEEETAAEEGKVRDDYEEDFEADDEGPAEEDKEKKSPSPTDEQAETQQVKERDASETEDDERDEDIKSRSGSSCSGSDREASDAEVTKDSREDEKPEQPEQPEEVDQEESLAPPEEKDEPKPEEAVAAAAEAESAVANDSELQDSAGDSTEIDISDSSVPSGTENKPSDDTTGDKKAEKMVDKGKEKEGQEQERAKSVQERLAEAMLTESHFTSEPELSDTTTEEEEEATDKGHKQSNNDVAPEKLLTATEEQQTFREAEAEAEVVQDLEETSEPREQEDETEKDPDENSFKDEMVKIDEGDENCEEEEAAAAEKEKSEDTGADLHPVSEESVTEDNKTSEPQEGAAAEPTEADAAQKDEENGETSAAVDEVQPDETGQGAKSSEEGESSVSELDKKTDETAVSDNAEAVEAMTASETMEMKAEPSEEQEALSCEEAPVTDTEERQQEDGTDGNEASETEVTADVNEKSADISEEDVKDEGNKDDIIKEEEAEEVLAAEASKDADQQEKMEEEQTENPVELDEEVEKEKSEEEEKQMNSDETPECENSEEKENNETKEEGSDGNKTEERIENEESIAEDPKSDSNAAGETNEEPAEKTLDIEDKAANAETDNESEVTEKDKERECQENKNDEEEPEAKGAINDKTDEDGEEIKETKMDVDEEKGDETEKDENKAEQIESEKNKAEEETEEKEVACETREEISANTEEPEQNADDVKISNENPAESQEVGDREAADETNTSEEVLNDITESGDVKKETDGAVTDSEKGEIDAESGEISARAESKTHIDEPEASTENNNDVKAAEHVEDERKNEEEPTEDESTEVKEESVKSGDDKVDRGPDVVESEHKEAEDAIEKQEESDQKDSEQETAVTETEEHEETKNENGNKSDLDTEKRDSDSTKDKDDNVHVALVASSAVEAESTPIDLGLDDTSHVLHESSHKPPQSDENADLSVADGENGADTEEASKASEEGASVLLKPQAQSNEADEAAASLGKQTPEALAAEDSADLVTNWITMHQTSKFFQTFVEPLEDLKEEASHAQESVTSQEATTTATTTTTELLRSESPPKMVTMSGEEEPVQKDESETMGENKVGAVESDIESRQRTEEEEETVVQELIPKADAEDNDKESANKLEDQLQDGPTLTQTEIYKTEVDSIAGTNHSVASGKPESVKEKQTTDNGPDLTEKQTEAEEITDLLSLSKTEEHGERSASPDGLRDREETQDNTNEQSGEVTEITDFTTSKSDDGSQEESHNGEIQPKPSDGSINGERRGVQLIQDIKHTLSKDRLSTFSVDETLFGRTSYPLLTAARTESGH